MDPIDIAKALINLVVSLVGHAAAQQMILDQKAIDEANIAASVAQKLAFPHNED